MDAGELAGRRVRLNLRRLYAEPANVASTCLNELDSRIWWSVSGLMWNVMAGIHVARLVAEDVRDFEEL